MSANQWDKDQFVNTINWFIKEHGWCETIHLLQLVVKPYIGRHVINCRDWFEELYEVLFDNPGQLDSEN